MIDKLLKATRDEDWHEASALLYKHWSDACPVAYTFNTEFPWENVFDENKISNELLYPLAAMFCGVDVSRDSESKDVSLEKINEIAGVDSSLLRKDKLCGRVFKNGDPTYVCRECATDPTCVFCHNCFVNSEHRFHKYKIHSSGGNGYCDCGDREAWSKHFACQLHSVGDDDDDDALRPQLPHDLRTRVYFATLIAVKFAVNLLCYQNEAELADFMSANNVDDLFQAVLYNDETHTYDAVIRALEMSIHCNTNQAMRLATIVDSEGRAIIKSANMDICLSVKEIIERRTSRETNRRTQKTGPLGVKVLKSSIVSYQNFAVKLLAWLGDKAQEYAPLGEIFGQALLYACDKWKCDFDLSARCGIASAKSFRNTVDSQCHASNCLRLMLEDRKLWKAARISFHNVLMSTILRNFGQKRDFGRLLIRHYARLYDDYIDDDHEHSVSVVSMTVQVFTVPTIARCLIAEEDALRTIMWNMSDFCSRHFVAPVRDNPKIVRFDFADNPNSAILRRAMQMFSDFSYITSMIPDPSHWTNSLRRNVSRGGIFFLRFLRFLDGMDEVRRQRGEHQTMENEWETAFNICIQMEAPLSLLLAWARTDPIVHMNLVKRSLAEIAENVTLLPEFQKKRVNVEVNSKSAFCIKFDVSTDTLSIHHPLWRFFAALFNAPPEILDNYVVSAPADDTREDADEILHRQWKMLILRLANIADLEEFQAVPSSVQKLDLRGVRTLLMEMPLRVFVLQAQSYAQLWRRNGFSLVNQLYNYSGQMCRGEMFDRDILMLQVCAALMNPDKFLIRIIDRFDLTRWARIGFEDDSAFVFASEMPATPSTTPEELSKISVFLAEEMLHLLIMIIGERYSPGLSACTPMQTLQREIFHFLCLGSKPFSQIEKIVPHDPIIGRLSIYDAINAVAVFKKPANNTAGHFCVKMELLAQYNYFFYHYSKQQISQADQHQKKLREDLSLKLKACPPPQPPEFRPFYRSILHLMESTTFVNLLLVVFERVDKRSRFASEGLYHRALFLTGMALNEQQLAMETGRHFGFWRLANDSGIFTLLQKLCDRVDAHADLLRFTMERYRSINDTLNDRRTESPIQDVTAVEKDSKKKRADRAEKQRKLALERMKTLQKAFAKQIPNATGGDGEDLSDGMSDSNNTYYDDDCEQGILSSSAGFPVCCGPNKTKLERVLERRITCILCQESEILSYNGKSIVCSGYMQNSRLFSTGRPIAAKEFDIFSSADLNVGLNISTCSHTMHYACYTDFMKNLSTRNRLRHRNRFGNPESGEYLCPLCKCFSTCILPLLPVMSNVPDIVGFSSISQKQEPFEKWLLCMQLRVSNSNRKTKKFNRKRCHSEGAGLETNESALHSTSLPIDRRDSSLISSPSSSPNNDSSIDDASHHFHLRSDTHDSSDSRSTSSDESVLTENEDMGLFFNRESNAESENANSRNLQEGIFRLMQCVFGSKKASNVCDMYTSNLPKSFTHWTAVAPFLNDLFVRHKIIFESPANEYLHNFVEMIDVLKACAFLLRSIHSILRVEEKPLFGALNTRQKDCLIAVVRLTSVVPLNIQPSGIQALIAHYLSLLLAGSSPQKRLSKAGEDSSHLAVDPTSSSSSAAAATTGIPHQPLLPPTHHAGSSKAANNHHIRVSAFGMRQYFKSLGVVGQPNIMDVDMLTLAIELIACIGWTNVSSNNFTRFFNGSKHFIADGSVDEHYVIRLTLLAHIFQIVFDFDDSDKANSCSHSESPSATTTTTTTTTTVTTTAQRQRQKLRCADISSNADILRRLEELYFACGRYGLSLKHPDALYEKICDAAVDFLRPLALFYHTLTLIPPPEALKDPSLNELDALCRYLGFTERLHEIILCTSTKHRFLFWHHKSKRSIRPPRIELPLKIKLLIDLPMEYSELINRAAKFRCPSLKLNNLSTAVPTLCLNCGEMICSQSYCCQRTLNKVSVGACTYHMSKCAESCGMFLRIRDCQVLLLMSQQSFVAGCHKPAPYVDEFGETDQGLRRGYPLQLSPQLYSKLQRIWIHQEVAEEIQNQYDINYRNIAFEWQHF